MVETSVVRSMQENAFRKEAEKEETLFQAGFSVMERVGSTAVKRKKPVAALNGLEGPKSLKKRGVLGL